MKILQIGKFQFEKKGGIELLTEQLCEGLANKGHEITFLCSGESDTTKTYTFGKTLVKLYSTWIKLNAAPFSPGMFFYLLKNRNKFDIIHVHLPNPFITMFVQIANPKAKIIAHWHSDIIKQKRLLKLYHPFLVSFLKKIDLLIASTENYLEGSEYLKMFRDKVKVVPLGIEEIEKPDQEIVEKWKNRYKGKKLVLSIGRLVYYKSFDVLVKAAGELTDDYHVIIIGGGDEQSELEKQIEELAPGRVEILNSVSNEDKVALLNACDIFALASSFKSEAYGLVQIEAMQFSKPLIACDIPGSGVSYVNMHDESGRIVPVGDYKAIASEIMSVCENHELYNRLSDGALKRYNEHFRLDLMIDRINKIYTDILAE